MRLALVGLLAVAFAACGGVEDSEPLATDVGFDPAPEAMHDMADHGAMGETAQFQELQGSGVSGEVMIHDRGDQTEVMVRLAGAPANSSHPGHIHSGSCDAIGGVVQALETIETDAMGAGTMTTTIDVAPSLVMNGEHIVVYHGGGEAITCAEIPAHMM